DVVERVAGQQFVKRVDRGAAFVERIRVVLEDQRRPVSPCQQAPRAAQNRDLAALDVDLDERRQHADERMEVVERQTRGMREGIAGPRLAALARLAEQDLAVERVAIGEAQVQGAAIVRGPPLPPDARGRASRDGARTAPAWRT